MKLRRRWAFLWLLLAWSVAPAAVPADLGEGLAYVRLKALPADLPDGPRAGPLVVDLRFLAAPAEQAAAFGAWLGFQARPGVPLLLVANRETGEELRRVLAAPRPPGVVLIGVPGPGFAPDLAVTASPEVDRQAYAALDAGVALAGLTPDLMLSNRPGVYCAGEMLDWEAPTGGYLLTACLASGWRAGQSILTFL